MKELTLELTNRCFNRCVHCSSNADINGNIYLNKEVIKNAIDKYNPEWINISGGEPLLHRNIIDIIKYINSKNIKIKLYTSGFIYNFPDVLKSIYAMVDIIVFPYYSIERCIFDKIVDNPECFYYTNEAIDLALKYKMNVQIHIVPMSLNLFTLDKTIDQLISKNITQINILKLVKQGRVKENIDIIPNMLFFDSVMKYIKEKYHDKIRLGLPLSEGKCVAGIDKMVVMYNGNEIPCESYKDGVCNCERIKIQ